MLFISLFNRFSAIQTIINLSWSKQICCNSSEIHPHTEINQHPTAACITRGTSTPQALSCPETFPQPDAHVKIRGSLMWASEHQVSTWSLESHMTFRSIPPTFLMAHRKRNNRICMHRTLPCPIDVTTSLSLQTPNSHPAKQLCSASVRVCARFK